MIRPERRVDFVRNTKDFEVVFLGGFGQSTKRIAEQTGYTTGQILYRLKKGQVKRRDYWNGVSPMVKIAIQRTRKVAMERLHAHLIKVAREQKNNGRGES